MIPNKERQGNRAPDWRAVRIDETRCWNREFLDKYGIEKMWGVYIIDFSSRTFCCSITPMYAMFFIESTWEGGPDEGEDLDVLFEEVLLADSGSQAVSYMRCSDIDRHIKDEKSFDKIDISSDEWEDDPNDGLEVAREYYVGNPTW